MMVIEENIEYWRHLKPPLCPNDYEIELFKHHTKGWWPICLFGMTQGLISLCDYMFDLYPTKQSKPVLQGNWNDFDEYAGAIIGDGILNLEGIQLAEKLYKKYNKLVFRVFLKKFPWMKYATHFPTQFPEAKLVIPTQEDIAIVVWEKCP